MNAPTGLGATLLVWNGVGSTEGGHILLQAWSREVSLLQEGEGPSLLLLASLKEKSGLAKQTSCQGSMEARKEMGPINSHLSLQIGVQVGRWKN